MQLKVDFRVGAALILLAVTCAGMIHAGHLLSANWRDRLLADHIVRTAAAWTSLMNFGGQGGGDLLDRSSQNERDQRLSGKFQQLNNINRYRLFGPDGKLIFDSMGPIEGLRTILDAPVLSEETLIQLRVRGSEHHVATKTIRTETRIIGIALLPLLRDGKLTGIVEVEIDVTSHASAISDAFTPLTAAAIASSVVLVLAVFALIWWGNRNGRTSYRQISHIKRHDTLTGLLNRSGLMAHLASLLPQVQANGRKLGIACIDIDRFKQLNDALGVDAGDQLLTEFAKRARENLRENDVVARLGGDEFAIVISDISDRVTAEKVAKRLRPALCAPFQVSGQTFSLTISIGLTIVDDGALTAAEALTNAEIALHRAKEEGRSSVYTFAKGMDATMREDLQLEADLWHALERNEIELHYQPQIDLRSGHTIACEALVRWRHPTRGMISPARFIHLAEQNGMIFPLSEWILRRACADAESWPDQIKVAVNLSPAQFTTGTVPAIVHDTLVHYGLPAERLELEVTEGLLLNNTDQVITALTQLREMNVGIAMDDFGTGYSSLSYLSRFPFSKIKIDRSFVADLSPARGNIDIVRAIVGLSEALNVTVMAEGAETSEQVDILRGLGCYVIQGYFYAKPMPNEALLQWLVERSKTPRLRLATSAA